MEAHLSSGRQIMIVIPGQTMSVESQPWNPHPKFAGVALRHIITGKDMSERMSIHHVRIDPGCAIGDHTHPGQVEIHDVIAGRGTCMLEGTIIPYTPGVISVMSADQVHRIEAGDTGLLLLATFSPPLV